LQRRVASIEARKESAEADKLRRIDWEREDFAWSSKLRALLSSTFGLAAFRPLQLSACNALLAGHDVYLVAPTGSGKSLCFQMPALVEDRVGVTLVIAPLVSLMEDQVLALKAKGVPAEMLSADTPGKEATKIMNALIDPKSPMRLLYVTPERLARSKRFMAKLQTCHKSNLLRMIAVDEVHCCSQWGHDFRPDYKYLGVLKTLFPNVPIIGLTATSTARVTEDCKKMLGLNKCLVFRANFNRPNLFYEIRPRPETHEDCVDAIASMLSQEFPKQSGIIYTLSVKDADTLARDLRGRGLRVAPYHAQLEAHSRSQIHRKWLSGEYQAVSATIAFGMGIDKADVRFVVHHSVSKSMENFYQESGRAGRDGKVAKCVAFFRFADVFRLSSMVFSERTGLEKLYGVLAYCVDYNRCRRAIIASHFGEEWESQDCDEMCDFCASKGGKNSQLADARMLAGVALSAIRKARAQDAKLTPLKVVNALLGKGEVKFRPEGWKGGGLTRSQAEHLLSVMLLEGHLKEDFLISPYNTISYLVEGARGELGLDGLNVRVPLEDKEVRKRASKVSSNDAKKSKISREEVIDLDSDEG